MDRRKLSLLRFFLKNCNEGYKVIEVSKIYDLIKKYKSNFNYLESDVDFLKKYKYIDVKYLDEINICFSVLDNSYVFQENLKSDKQINRKYVLFMIISMLLSGTMAFVGAFLAILIIR